MKINCRFIVATSGWITASILLFSCGLKYVNGDDVPVEQYLGCFYGNKTHWSDVRIRSSLGFGECIRRCREDFNTATFARFENLTTCKCGNNSGVQLQDSLCNSKCLGDSSQFCGGEYQGRLSAYVLYSVCPIGLYGPQCDKICHCRHQIPCNRKTGKCPNECDGNYTGDQCDRRAGSISDQYIGCFRDEDLPALPHRTDMGEDSTLDLCLDICFGNYSYAGALHYSLCFCGERYDKYGPLPESGCNTRCKKDKSQTCGGPYANSVYHSCPQGNYGPRCSKICNCEGRCHYHNGSCLNKVCRRGWMGDACNLRDCSQNNGGCNSGEECKIAEPILSKHLSVCRCSTGFWRKDLWKSCIDINECSEIPDICGSTALSCINTDGGYKCEFQNGSFVTDSWLTKVSQVSNEKSTSRAVITDNQELRIGLIVGGALFGILLLIAILFAALKFRSKRNPSYTNDPALQSSEDMIGTYLHTFPESNPSPEFQEGEYAELDTATMDDNINYSGMKTHRGHYPNSRSAEEEYAGLDNRTMANSRVYLTLKADDYDDVA